MVPRESDGSNREWGQAIVELALCMTFLTLMVLGAVDMARLYGTAEQVTNAAHEGAKVAAEYYDSYSSNPSGLTALVKSQIVKEGLLNSSSIVNLSISTQTPATPDYSGQQIVQVTLQYKFNFLGPWRMIPGLTNPYTMPAVTSAETTR
jgi:Flp pilus assembly protein TadG